MMQAERNSGRGAVPGEARGASVEVWRFSKRFSGVVALDEVSLAIRAGSFQALLGENGAGKSTLAYCLLGHHRVDEGQVLVDGRERSIRSPHDAHALGLGMVHQRFTLVPSMTAAENLVLSRDDVPAVVRWRHERERLEAFAATMPFHVRLHTPVASLAAGEKQKLEILAQLYLGRRFIVLDEPTSVLTPQEADEVLGLLHGMTRQGRLTILLITHKFREVMAFADAVAVLRRGRLVGNGPLADFTPASLAELMMGQRVAVDRAGAARPPAAPPGPVRLAVRSLTVPGDRGVAAAIDVSVEVRAGEIVGVAGVSGNGQRELVEALVGQRQAVAGEVRVEGERYSASRAEMRRHGVSSLPEEPLRNACVADLSLADNLALRAFDVAPLARRGFLRHRAIRAHAAWLMAEFQVKSPGPEAAIATLSGGNIQRAVLARELSGHSSVLIAANPTFGLDFAAVADVHRRIQAARAAGAAVLLVSEDLDELLELSDRILVMQGGRIVHETAAAGADTGVLGAWMAGHGGGGGDGEKPAAST
jgi:simple sugar transport system ATP-binding protein